MALLLASAGSGWTQPEMRVVWQELGDFQGDYKKIFVDSQGTLWLGGNHLARMRGGRLENPGRATGQNFDNIHISQILERDGSVWFSSFYGGIYRYGIRSGQMEYFSLGRMAEPKMCHAMVEDPEGGLIFCTYRQGLFRLSPGAERADSMCSASGSPVSLDSVPLFSLLPLRDGGLLAGTDRGVFRIDLLPEGRYRAAPYLPGRLPIAPVRFFAELDDGTIAIVVEFELLALVLKNGTVRFLRLEDISMPSESSNSVTMRGLLAAAGGKLLLNMRHMGIAELEVENMRLEWRYLQAPGDLSINAMDYDGQGNILLCEGDRLGTSPLNPFFELYSRSSSGHWNLNAQSVRGALLDPYGVLWVGGYEGLNRIVPGVRSQLCEQMAQLLENKVAPFGLLHAPQFGDTLWVSFEGEGMVKILLRDSLATSQRVRVFPPGGDATQMYQMASDDSSIWVGHMQGLSRFNPSKGTWEFFHHSPQDDGSLQAGDIIALNFDRDGYLWVGSRQGGLSKLRYSGGRIECQRFNHVPGDSLSLSSDAVYCVTQSRDGYIWVGTGNQLNRLDPRTGRFKRISTRDGLPDDLIYGILEDSLGRLWLSTNRGIARLDPSTGQILTFDKTDGLQDNEFNTGAYHKARDGRFFLGGISGFTAFDPMRPNDFERLPVPRWGGIWIDGQRADSLLPAILPELALREPLELRLDYSAGPVRLEVHVNEHVHPNRVRLAWRLLGQTENWNEVGGSHMGIDLGGLYPGEYTLQVKVRNPHGLWSGPRDWLRFDVRPPFWARWWFAALALLALVGLSMLYLRWRTRSLVEKNLRQEALIVERTQEIETKRLQLQENADELAATNAKLQDTLQLNKRLTAMVAHDLKQPLSLILNHSTDSSVRQAGFFMKRLIENMLDLHRNESAGLEIHLGSIRLKTIVDRALEQTEFMLRQKNIRLVARIPAELEVEADAELLTRVLMNFISNAAKYSPENQPVWLRAMPQGEQLARFEIEDRGPGVSAGKVAQLFQDFQRDGKREASFLKSTGLGLAFNKMAIQALGGQIGYENASPQGARFWFSLTMTLAGAAMGDEQEAEPQAQAPWESDELSALFPFHEKLSALSAYEFSDVKKVLGELPIRSDKGKAWQAKVLESLVNCNQEQYSLLVREIQPSNIAKASL